MKRIIVMLLAVVMLLGLSACGDSKKKSADEETYDWQIDVNEFEKMDEDEQEAAIEAALEGLDEALREEEEESEKKEEPEVPEISDYGEANIKKMPIEDISATNIEEVMGWDFSDIPVPYDTTYTMTYETTDNTPKKSPITGEPYEVYTTHKLKFTFSETPYKKYYDDLYAWLEKDSIAESAQAFVVNKRGNRYGGTVIWKSDDTAIEVREEGKNITFIHYQ